MILFITFGFVVGVVASFQLVKYIKNLLAGEFTKDNIIGTCIYGILTGSAVAFVSMFSTILGGVTKILFTAYAANELTNGKIPYASSVHNFVNKTILDL